jgi:hypothetical protein
VAASLAWEEAEVLAQFVSDEPTPEFVAMVAEETIGRLNALPDPTLRQIAIMRMEGHSNPEIAARLGCNPRSVERKLRVIRTLWGDDASS